MLENAVFIHRGLLFGIRIRDFRPLWQFVVDFSVNIWRNFRTPIKKDSKGKMIESKTFAWQTRYSHILTFTSKPTASSSFHKDGAKNWTRRLWSRDPTMQHCLIWINESPFLSHWRMLIYITFFRDISRDSGLMDQKLRKRKKGTSSPKKTAVCQESQWPPNGALVKCSFDIQFYVSDDWTEWCIYQFAKCPGCKGLDKAGFWAVFFILTCFVIIIIIIIYLFFGGGGGGEKNTGSGAGMMNGHCSKDVRILSSNTNSLSSICSILRKMSCWLDPVCYRYYW